MKDDYLKLAVALHRMRTGDEGVRLFKYREYTHLITTERSASLTAAFPLRHLFQELSRSNAGRNLTLSHLDVSHVSMSGYRRGPAPRLLTLQRRLQERCQAAGGVAMTDYDMSFQTTGSMVRSPLTATRFHSPPSKVSPQRTYTQESKYGQRSPESRRAGGVSPTATARARQAAHMRGHLHALFSPQKDEAGAEGAGHAEQSGVRRSHPMASPPMARAHTRTPFAASASRLAVTDVRAALPQQVRGGGFGLTGLARGGGGTVQTAADSSYIPSARLFSPQAGAASPFASNITPYQPPRQRGTDSLPTGDIRTVQIQPQFLRTQEMI